MTHPKTYYVDVSMPRRPDRHDLSKAAILLARLAAKHGLRNLWVGEGDELVVDVDPDRTYFDVVAFEDEVEGRLGFRPEVVPSGAEGARPHRRLAPDGTHAA